MHEWKRTAESQHPQRESAQLTLKVNEQGHRPRKHLLETGEDKKSFLQMAPEGDAALRTP